MSVPEQFSKPLPVDDDVIIKLPENTIIESFGSTVFDASDSTLYVSAKEFIDKVTEPILDNFGDLELLEEGVKAGILEPEKKWVAGKIRLRLGFQFIPDKPELPETPSKNQSVSPLDDIRKTMNGVS